MTANTINAAKTTKLNNTTICLDWSSLRRSCIFSKRIVSTCLDIFVAILRCFRLLIPVLVLCCCACIESQYDHVYDTRRCDNGTIIINVSKPHIVLCCMTAGWVFPEGSGIYRLWLGDPRKRVCGENACEAAAFRRYCLTRSLLGDNPVGDNPLFNSCLLIGRSSCTSRCSSYCTVTGFLQDQELSSHQAGKDTHS